MAATIFRGNYFCDMDYLDYFFPIVKSSSLILEDAIFKHNANSVSEHFFKERLQKVVEKGVPDFRAQIMEPSIEKDDELYFKANICNSVECPTIYTKDIEWWFKKIEKFMPQKNSRIGTVEQRTVFWALLLKQLLVEGCDENTAWRIMCDENTRLSNINTSKIFKTGTKNIGIWCDLVNSRKLVIGEGVKIVGSEYNYKYGIYNDFSAIKPFDYTYNYTAWIVADV